MDVAMPMEDSPRLPSGLAEVNKMIQEHGDLFSDSQCKVCSAVLISESQKLTHYQSKKHANKVRRFQGIQNETEPQAKKIKSHTSEADGDGGGDERNKACHVCNMTFYSAVMAESHYQGKVHAKNLRLKALSPRTPGEAPPPAPPAVQAKKKAPKEPSGDSGSAGNGSDPDRFCSICQASFNNPLMAQQHYAGKKHKKHLTKKKLMETYGPASAPASTPKGYSCSLCNIDLNSVEQYQAHVSGAKHKNQLKRSGMNPPDNQLSKPEKFVAEDEQFVDEGDGFAASADDQYAAGDDDFVSRENEFPAEEHQYVAGDNQFYAGDNQFDAGDNQFVAGDNQFGEQACQYT